MSNRLTKLMRSSAGNAGTQGDFLDECWEIALPTPSVTHGNAGTESADADAARSCVTERFQVDRQHKSPEIPGNSALRSCVPANDAHENETIEFDVDWQEAAVRLTNQFTHIETQRHLFTLFYERSLYLRSGCGMDRHAAEREAYGWLLTKALNLALAAQFDAKDANT